ncbi:MAG: pyruvate, water dikinase regulatory protein [Gammaproteobacteria bacterium]
MTQTRTVFYISDGTGLTVEGLGHSLLAQFGGLEYNSVTLPFVNSSDQAGEAVQQINAEARQAPLKPLVFCTLVDPQARSMIRASEAVCFDLYDAFLGPVGDALGMTPSGSVGRSHGMDNHTRYGMRMDAVNFALSTDDGSTTHGYEHADVIVVGVSRSGKTPTCLYLALQYGVLAANYPLTEEDLEDSGLPALLKPYRNRLYGLTIDPDRLHEIRSERRPDSRYASMKQCRYELRQLAALYRHEGLHPLDTTNMSVEEIATTIVHDLALHRRMR